MKKTLATLVLTASAAYCFGCGGQAPYQQGYQGGPQGQNYQGQNYQGQQGYAQGMGMQNVQDMQGQNYQGQGYSQGMGMQNPQYMQEQNYQGQQGYSGMGAQGSQDMQGSQTDMQLQGKVQDSLRSSFSSKYNNVNATVSKGYVTLTGTVATQDDKMDLDKKVRTMDGVQGVNNQIMVQGQQGSSSQQ